MTYPTQREKVNNLNPDPNPTATLILTIRENESY